MYGELYCTYLHKTAGIAEALAEVSILRIPKEELEPLLGVQTVESKGDLKRCRCESKITATKPG